MSLYNMINGVNPATFFFLPMLGKHPDEYPRFRDCFTNDESRPDLDNHIHIYTRTGGGNREYYQDENQAMQDMDHFVTDYDDEFDSTFASWVFRVPEKWADDYNHINKNRFDLISEQYVTQFKTVYPKLVDQIDSLIEQAKNEAAKGGS